MQSVVEGEFKGVVITGQGAVDGEEEGGEWARVQSGGVWMGELAAGECLDIE